MTDHADIVREALIGATRGSNLNAAVAALDALADRCARWEGKWHEAESALRREREVASSSLNGLLIRATEAEAERDEAVRTIANRDAYSRKTGCDCHDNKDDPDYSPAYQDEYQRLWHEAAARAEAAEAEAARLKEALREFVEECGVVFADPRVGYVEVQINVGCLERARAALAGEEK